MGHLEEIVFANTDNKPHIYCRYVDDIFIQTPNEDSILQLKQLFTENSKLNFTYEMNTNNKLPFLDVLVNNTNNSFSSTVYHKPTDLGTCLNNLSQCTDKYKSSVINDYLNRAFSISTNWTQFHSEIQHIKQTLVNNNYPCIMIDNKIKAFLEKLHSPQVQQNTSTIPIYFQNQMHSNYKTDERVIKDIVMKNTQCNNPDTKLNLIIYYKNPKTSNLVLKNNMSPPPTKLQTSNVVYKFICPYQHGEAEESYIGETTTSLSRRLTMHKQSGSIQTHFQETHHVNVTREQLTENTTILAKENNKQKLLITEALLILKENPTLNIQFDNFYNILKLFKHRNVQINRPNYRPPIDSTQSSGPNTPPRSNISNNSIVTPFATQNASPNITERINRLFEITQQTNNQNNRYNLRPRN